MPYTDRILLAVLLNTAYGRGVLRGINSYARPQKPWVFHIADPDDHLLDVIQDWNPTGIVVDLYLPQIGDALSKLGRPVVNIANYLGDNELPRIGVFDDQVGKLVADHFMERQFHHFAFIGFPEAKYSNDREAGFALALQSRGHSMSTYYQHANPNNPHADRGGAAVDENIRKWVISLPKPVAIMACNDRLALEVAEVCRQSELRIPEDIALCGSGNDELLCDLAHPPVSSVALPAQRIGYEAASLLDQLLRGDEPPREPILMAPAGIVTRQSSDILAMEDPEVSTAISYIHDHIEKAINVTDVVGKVKISRRSLERRFRAAIGRSPLEEIRRVKIERAMHLLANTSLAMPMVAKRAGFTNAKLLSTIFHEETGFTPTAYRRQFRLQEN